MAFRELPQPVDEFQACPCDGLQVFVLTGCVQGGAAAVLDAACFFVHPVDDGFLRHQPVPVP